MLKEKIKKREELKGILSRLKKEGKKIVFTNGCFDILHAGHVEYLREAKALGDILLVAINTDRSVKRVKGEGRPVTNETDRAKILAALETVDFVTFFDEESPGLIVEELSPDIIVKGGDWKENEIIGGDHVKRSGGRVLTVPFRKGYSTSAIIEKIKKLK